MRGYRRRYRFERDTSITRREVLPVPFEFQVKPKTESIHKILTVVFEGVPYVQVSDESDQVLVSCPTMSSFVSTMFKIKAILMANGLDKLVSVGHN